MGLIYADTSALVKRHIAESGSAWVRGWIAPGQGNSIVVSAIALPEVTSALARLRRQRLRSAQSFTRLQNDFLLAFEEEYLIIPVARALLALASDLVARYPLRTLDAIHLASATTAAQRFIIRPTFVAADQRLLAAAAEGFPTDDPNNH